MSENGSLYLSRDQILNASDINFDEVKVPEWGGTVRIKSLSGEERSLFEGHLMRVQHKIRVGGKKGGDDTEVSIDYHEHKARVLLCALSICDEHGNRLFGEEEVEKLGKKSASALRRVFDCAMRLSGMNAEAQEELTGESDAEAASA